MFGYTIIKTARLKLVQEENNELLNSNIKNMDRLFEAGKKLLSLEEVIHSSSVFFRDDKGRITKESPKKIKTLFSDTKKLLL